MLGRESTADHPEATSAPTRRAVATERRLADRLSRVLGQPRDEVLAEAYRRADRILAGPH
jgi:hypothetical protein